MTTASMTSMCTVAIVTAVFASSTGAAVYKCSDGGKALYSHVPCKGGAVVDVRAGTADPAAIDRLEREGYEFDRNMTVNARRAADDAAAMQREALNAQVRQAEAAQRTAEAAANSQPQYYGGYGFAAPRVKGHVQQHKHVNAPKSDVRASPVPPPRQRRDR
jgi:hypothetical protein